MNLYGLSNMRINPLHALDFGEEVVKAITSADLSALAATYLDNDKALIVVGTCRGK